MQSKHGGRVLEWQLSRVFIAWCSGTDLARQRWLSPHQRRIKTKPGTWPGKWVNKCFIFTLSLSIPPNCLSQMMLVNWCWHWTQGETRGRRKWTWLNQFTVKLSWAVWQLWHNSFGKTEETDASTFPLCIDDKDFYLTNYDFYIAVLLSHFCSKLFYSIELV